MSTTTTTIVDTTPDPLATSATSNPQKSTTTAEIKPDHYYDWPHDTFNPPAEAVPVFKPTFEEFQDFSQFVNAILPFGFRSSIVKVIPPPEWQQSLPDIQDNLNKVEIRSAIYQHFFGKGGIYVQTNIESRRRFTAESFKNFAQNSEAAAATPTEDLLHSSKKPRLNNENSSSITSNTTTTTTDIPNTTNINTNPKSTESSEEEWSVERCKELERNYWRNLTYQPPMYGADLPGSLFGDNLKVWNPANLGDLLTKIPNAVPGVNTPYLYFGMWKATFAWHVEDMDLFSINYIHFGAPKQWYSIPGDYRQRFEQLAQNTFPQEFKKCPEFLRHKTFVLSPSLLAGHSIPVGRLVQKAGEFVITFPRGYHAGYNLGFNCAESVNFATSVWLNIGDDAQSCACVTDSVKIDVKNFKRLLMMEDPNFTLPESVDSFRRPTRRPSFQNKIRSTQKSVPFFYHFREQDFTSKVKCLLCATNSGDLLPFARSSTMTESLTAPLWAHQVCATFLPETRVMTKIDAKEQGFDVWDEELCEMVVVGVENIFKDRWKLKCHICGVQGKGAPVQCMFGKCVKAFHVTCAQAKGLCMYTMESTNTVTPVIFCLHHHPQERAARHEQRHSAKLSKFELIPLNSKVLVKQEGTWRSGLVVARHPDTNQCTVQFDEG